MNPTTITRIRSGAIPRRALRPSLKRAIADYARARLRDDGVLAPLDDDSTVRVYAWFSRHGDAELR